jgi:excisionase family DNA binding protein
MQNESEQPSKPEIGTFEASRLIGVSVPTVRALAERGELSGWKIGKCYKFSRAAVDEFLNRNVRPLAV